MLSYRRLDMEEMVMGDNFQAYLSENDKDALFENLFKRNLNGFAYKRSISIFMGRCLVGLKNTWE